MKINITLDNEKIKQLQTAVSNALEQTTESLKTDINNSAVVPKNTGELEQSGFVSKVSNNKYKISYDTPYARRLYWNPQYNFRTDKNINAQGSWLDSYKNGSNKTFFSDTFKIFLKMNARGVIK